MFKGGPVKQNEIKVFESEYYLRKKFTIFEFVIIIIELLTHTHAQTLALHGIITTA